MKVLFLNPPGRRVYIRDYYCSKVSQANYISHPMDFVIMSARLRHENCDVTLVDAIAEGLSPVDTLRRIGETGPDVIVALAGAVSWDEDRKFFECLKSKQSVRLIVSGDLFQQDAGTAMEDCDFLDGVVLDFTTPDIGRCVMGTSDPLEGIIQRVDGSLVGAKPADADNGKEFVLKTPPMHALFQRVHYRYPFTLSKRYCSVLTEYGCPFHCTFCIMGKLKAKRRPVDDVLSELEEILSLDVREVFFVDQTFASGRERSVRLLSAMIERRMGLRWFGFSRVDVLDENLLALMKEAGCHTLILGIESGSDEILAKYRKGYDRAMVVATVRLCARMGIRTVGTFILGLPEETKKTIGETLRLLKSLPLDYASFNVAVPRAGTDLRREAVSLGLASSDQVRMDQSGSEVAMPTRHLTREQVTCFRRQAVKEFYLRPTYLLKRLVSVGSFYQLLRSIENGVALLRNTWR